MKSLGHGIINSSFDSIIITSHYKFTIGQIFDVSCFLLRKSNNCRQFCLCIFFSDINAPAQRQRTYALRRVESVAVYVDFGIAAELSCACIKRRQRSSMMLYAYVYTVYMCQGCRQGGHWAMPPLGAEGVLCDCSVPSNCECIYRENAVGGRTQAPSGAFRRRKVPPKSLAVCLQRKCSWRVPLGALRRPLTTKSPSEKSLQ